MVRPAEVGSACAHFDTVELLGYPVACGDPATLAGLLWQRIVLRECTHVVTLNPEIIVRARRDRFAADALRRADVFIADGVGVVWAAKVLKRNGVTRYPGIDLAGDLLRMLAAEGGSVYLLGAAPGVAEQAGAKAAAAHPGLLVCGMHHGFFSSEDEAQVVANICAAQPDLLLIGMGSPKQEQFIVNHRQQLQVPLAIGVGGALDVLAGVKKRAPQWVQRLGLEWAFRALGDISRYKRLGVLPVFINLVLHEAQGETG